MINEKYRISKSKIKWGVLYLLYLLIVFLPIIKSGIQCNDDLQWRMYSSQGFATLAEKYYDAALVQGRVLSAVQIISLYISFFPNRLMFGLMKAVLISSNIVGIAVLIKRYVSVKIAMIYAILTPLFIQITLQLSPPDAFTAFVTFPFTLLLLSVYLFADYLQDLKKWKLVLSLLLYLFVLCSYEIFILYSPIFFVIALENNNWNIVKSIWSIKWHIGTGVFYLFLYILVRFIFPSEYAGNQVEIVSFEQSVNVWSMLIRTGLPAGYVFDPKAMYLLGLGMNSTVVNLKELITKEFDIRVLIVAFMAGVLFWKVLGQKEKFYYKKSIFPVGIIVGYIIFLPIINAISKSWGTIDTSVLMGGTVSYLILLFVSVFFSWILIMLYEWLKSKKYHIFANIVVVACICYGLFVQMWNNSYSVLAVETSDRIERIEGFLETETVKNLEDVYYSPQACEPYLMQVAPAGYWGIYSTYNNVPLITDKYEEQFGFANMLNNGRQWIAGNSIEWVGKKPYIKDIYLFSEDALNGKKVLFKQKNSDVIEYICQSQYLDGDYYIQHIILNDEIIAEDLVVEIV